MSSVKKITICSICVALCYALPLAFHALALGSIFSPMHLPVFLCGLICGWQYGLICGVAGPLVSSLLSGMPPASQLFHMIPELCVYGVVCGLLVQLIRTKSLYADLYLSLIPAMLMGRVVAGVVRAVVYLSSAQTYSVALWAASYFVESVPALIMHLAAIPSLIVVLMKAKLIPQRYSFNER